MSLYDENHVQEKRMDFKILGRKIGTYTGWDKADAFAIQVYDFVPLEELDLPKSDCISFDLETGMAEIYPDIIDGVQPDSIMFDFAPMIVHLPVEK